MIRLLRLSGVLPAIGVALACAFSGMVISGCELAEAPGGVAEVQAPIINGELETGWPAVGALVLSYPFYGFTGSFCSGTLIDKRWVLTAAHCATPSADFPIAPGLVSFMFTNDARPAADGSRPAGTLVQSDYFIPHEYYDGRDNDYDIALVHLVRDVTEITPVPVNTSSLSNSGFTKARFVGFGVDNGATETGGGLKRWAEIPISNIDGMTFNTDAYDKAVCFGDSGGPALRQYSGTWKVVGVNSAVMGYGDDPCQGIGIHVRVDAHSTWLNDTMGDYPPDCGSDSDACLCDAACANDGTCDVEACWVSNCGEVTDCVFGCYSASNPDACAKACFIGGDDLVRERFDNVMGCYGARCYQSGTAWDTCMSGTCNDRYNECYLSDREKLDCAGVFDCYSDCMYPLCKHGCEYLALPEATSDWANMKTCFESSCAGKTGSDLTTCLSESCPTQTTGCLKPDECDPTGGDCDAGWKCRQYMAYTTTCVESQGKGLGVTCKIETGKADPCADGLMCVSGENGRLCRQVCLKSEGCGDGEVCKGQPFPDLAEYGWCGCEDVDEDSVCSADDCDDTRDNVYPGAREYCEGIDNNCDGVTDEGCTTTCPDADDDGSCDEADCDDERDNVYPGAIENCDDNLDNNCDGTTDEGCETCTDLDKDGFCSDRDCNDRDYRVSPSADEKCDDGIDNDCDGQKDENCQVVTQDVIDLDATVSADDGAEVGEDDDDGCTAGRSSGAAGMFVALLLLPLAVMGWRRRFN